MHIGVIWEGVVLREITREVVTLVRLVRERGNLNYLVRLLVVEFIILWTLQKSLGKEIKQIRYGCQ